MITNRTANNLLVPPRTVTLLKITCFSPLKLKTSYSLEDVRVYEEKVLYCYQYKMYKFQQEDLGQ